MGPIQSSVNQTIQNIGVISKLKGIEKYTKGTAQQLSKASIKDTREAIKSLEQDSTWTPEDVNKIKKETFVEEFSQKGPGSITEDYYNEMVKKQAMDRTNRLRLAAQRGHNYEQY